ncbi:MAG: hypothetical protein F9K25_17130 [Candidatus Contendobacter sp.]|nr:MAG: hypothetical protein F9K25_17130 [Candidatus Contendobacter sp.]
MPWLKENVRFSQPTASRYMALASNYSRVNNLPSLREALAYLAEESDRNIFLCSTPVAPG